MGGLRKTYWFKVFAISLLTACVGIVPHIIEGGGCLMMSNDYAALFIPQTMLSNQVIKSGNLLWNWGIDLGGNFLESVGVGSVFSLFLLLFPTKSVPYLMGWMVILKFAAAAVVSSLYFKRQFKDERVVIICSLLYAFSGYQVATIIFWVFQDVTALFPLMLLGVEVLVEEKKHGVLILSTILNVTCGLTFFFGEIIFTILYFGVKYIDFDTIKSKRMVIARMRDAAYCVFEGGIGIICAGISVIPVVRNLLTNNRVSNHISVDSWFSITTTDFLQTIKAFLLPAEPMSHQASVVGSDWYSNTIYLPVVGMVFALSYLLIRKDWKSRLAKICVIVSIIPLLNSVFMFCSWEPYKRWYYMLALVMILVTGSVLEKPECFSVTKAAALNLVLIAFFVLMTAAVKWGPNSGSLIFERHTYYLNLGVALLGVIICTVHLRAKENSLPNVILLSVVLFSAGLTFLQIESCKNVDNSCLNFSAYNSGYAQSALAYITETSDDLSSDILPYRYYFDENIGYTYYDLSMVKDLPSINSFCSTVHGSVTDFYNSIGVGRHTMTVSVGNGMKELLSAKYIVSVAERPEYKLLSQKTLSSGQVIYYYENEKALPIGFTYDQYMTESEFQSIDPYYRPVLMLNSMVVKDEAVASAGSSLSHFENYDLDELANHIDRALGERRRESSVNFEYSSNIFSSMIDADSEKYAFFTVPYDDCWSATVNNEKVDILNVQGLMAVPIPAGRSEIVFQYRYTPLWYGILFSIAGIGISIMYIYFSRKKYFPIETYHLLNDVRTKNEGGKK